MNKKDFEYLTRTIRNRRAVFPAMFTKEKVADEVIWQILENANWAPTHQRTEPWRFRVFTGEALKRVGDYLAEYYSTHTPKDTFSEIKYRKNLKKPQQSSHVIFLCMQCDPKERVPEWEELAALSCAVMNMWLSCTALGLGCYWSSTAAALEADEFLDLEAGEKCFGLMYIGVPQPELKLIAERGDVREKVVWVGE
jgi:nitroreductase